MKKVVLISCASKKLQYKTKAKELYISSLFRFSLQYAQNLKPDFIFILSAEHGLLELEDGVAPYNLTLNNMKAEEIKYWAKIVLKKLSQKVNLERDQIIFLAGEKYRKYLIPYIKNYQIPLEGLPIGKQLQYFKKNIKSYE